MKRYLYVLVAALLLTTAAGAHPVAWTQADSALHPFIAAGSGVLGNYLFCFGAQMPLVPSAQAFNLTTEQWEESTVAPFGIDSYGSATTDSAIYLIGSLYASGQLGVNVQKFTPIPGGPTGVWTQMASYPVEVADPACAWDGGNYLYSAGGYNSGGGWYNVAYRYDLAANTWTPIANMPSSNALCGGAFINGRFYVVGGMALAGHQLFEYDPGTNVWTIKPGPPIGVPAANYCTTFNDSLIFTAGGGGEGYPASAAVQVYNPLTGVWIGETPLPQAICYNTARFVAPNKVISAAGYLEPGIQGQSTTYRGTDFPSSIPSLYVTLSPINPPIIIRSNGGTFRFNASVERTVGPQAPFRVWARIKYPDGSYTAPTLGPVLINPPVGVTVTRQRIQNVPGSWPAGLYTYLAYGNLTFTYPAIDSSSFTFTKSATADGGAWVTEALCTGEPFPGEELTVGDIHPSSFILHPCNPNPFNPTTAISYQLSANSHVSLRVYDTAGRLVATLVDGWREAGTHEVNFDGTNLSSGIYLAKLTAGNYTAVQKLVLLK